METNQTIPLCRYCGNKIGDTTHHLLKRSTNPELIDEPKNQVRLCSDCHSRTENDHDFFEALQQIFYYWKPANLDLFLRAQASIESILSGRPIEYLTPAMADNYLTLASQAYSFYSNQEAQLEKFEAPFYLDLKTKNEKYSDNLIKMMWKSTKEGQKMIEYKHKLKALEKFMAGQRSKEHRFKMERLNPIY